MYGLVIREGANLELSSGNSITVDPSNQFTIESGGNFIDRNPSSTLSGRVERFLDSQGGTRGYYISPSTANFTVNSSTT